MTVHSSLSSLPLDMHGSTSFHYAFKVLDLASTRKFYVDILGCQEGRSAQTWVDFDFFGHQLSAHIGQPEPLDYCGWVEGIKVPIPHFGCLLKQEQFNHVHKNLQSANIEFIVKPHVRYAGQASEQRTLFVLDYSLNPIEFKTFTDVHGPFKKTDTV